MLATLALMCALGAAGEEPPATDKVDLGAYETVVAALPEDDGAQIRAEVAVMIPDLRVVQASGQRSVQLRQLLTLADREAQEADWLGQLRAVLEISGIPADEPVPAFVAGCTRGAGFAVQAAPQVAPGFADRLRDHDQKALPLPMSLANGSITMPVRGHEFVGQVGADGWLRMALDGEFLTGPGEVKADFVAESAAQWLRDTQGAVVIRGQGVLAFLVASRVAQPLLRGILSSMNSVILAWRDDGDRTASVRLLLDSPTLAQFAAQLRPPAVHNSFAEMWGDEVMEFGSVHLPPLALTWLRGKLEEKGGDAVADPLALTEQLSGRVGYAGYGAPGDWAVGVEFLNPAAAEAALPLVSEALETHGAKLKLELSQFVRAADPGLQISPHPELAGLHLTVDGDKLLLVSDAERMRWLLGDQRRQLELTEPMRALRRRQALALMYAVSASDGRLLQGLPWAAALAATAETWRTAAVPSLGLPAPTAEEDQGQAVGADTVAEYLDSWPILAQRVGFEWSMQYDSAISVDLDGPMVVVEMMASGL